jgi:hypothetical protein
MILWHCTTVDSKAVVGKGLVPGENSWKDWIGLLGPATPKENVVWLTAIASFPGRPSRWAYKCIIPSTDRKLVKFEKVLRKARADLKALRQEDERILHWYVYFGTIYPVEVARIRLRFEDGFNEQEQKEFIEKWG